MKKKTTKGTIYVCDDDPGIQEVIQLILSESYLVKTFNNCSSIRKGIVELKPDLVLTDLKLNGEADLPQMVAELHNLGTPVIIVSGMYNASEIARQIGADALIEKPFSVEVLVSTVEKQLES